MKPFTEAHALIAAVEAAHFRTVDDTGAHPCAMTVLNCMRREAGLPYLSRDDLPAWDGTRYAAPPTSRLLSNRPQIGA